MQTISSGRLSEETYLTLISPAEGSQSLESNEESNEISNESFEPEAQLDDYVCSTLLLGIWNLMIRRWRFEESIRRICSKNLLEEFAYSGSLIAEAIAERSKWTIGRMIEMDFSLSLSLSLSLTE